MTESTTNKKKKSNSDDRVFTANFKYTTGANPYHNRLEIFDQFVLQDEQGEDYQGRWNQAVFKNDHPLEVEIGSGYGHFMMEHTQKNPNYNFIGLDHRFKRSFHLAKKLATLKFKNFRYLRARGERLSYLFGENELTHVYYFFPDPWPKHVIIKKDFFKKNFSMNFTKC